MQGDTKVVDVMTHDVQSSSILRRLAKPAIRYPFLFMMLGLAAALIISNLLAGNFGKIGQDSDDLLRFMQIRDYLRGQSWFDTDQTRMGLTAAGTDMHWSRLPDIPIILLTHFFDIFTTQDKALTIAISIWPPLLGLIFFAAIMLGARQIKFEGNRKYLLVITAFLAAFFVLNNFRFEAGAIDHHNLQFVFMTLAMVWAMDRQIRASRFLLSGLATATCLAIGPEVYLFAAVVCGFVALNWAVKGAAANRAAQGFGIGLSVGLGAMFLATTPPADYGVIYCDALSLITVTAAGFGGLGLALTAKMSGSYGGSQSLIRRFAALIVLGVICLTALSFQAPQCLANPLDSLPAEVTDLWLGNVEEASPIYKLKPDGFAFASMVMGPALLAVALIFYSAAKRDKTGGTWETLWSSDILILLLLLTAIALSVLQVRFAPFTYIFALLILARWIAQLYESGLKTDGSNLKYIFGLALSIPMIWAVPGLLMSSDPEDAGAASNGVTTSANCDSDDVLAALNKAPKGLVVASSNMTGSILIHTDHSAVSGNYHRNWQGISTEIKISTSAPEQALGLMRMHKIDYFLYCLSPDLPLYSEYNSGGLLAEIGGGNIPNFLKPISDPALENGDVILFKIIRE